MIAYVRGILTDKEADSIVVEAGQVGYGIHVPMSVLEALPPVGEEVKIYTHMAVKEDDMSLYGFLSREELAMFRMLIGVNKIGPKGAMGILSALTLSDLRMALFTGDVKRIAKAPGIGARTAQRLVLELKDRISADDVLTPPSGSGEVLSAQDVPDVTGTAKEAVEALTALGYSAFEAAKAVKKVEITGEMSTEDVLKASLKYLAFL